MSEYHGKEMKANSAVFITSVLNVIWYLVTGRRYSLNDKELLDTAKCLGRHMRRNITANPLAQFRAVNELFPEMSGLNGFRKIRDMINGIVKNDIEAHRKCFNKNASPKDFIDAYLLEIEKEGENESFNENNLTVDCFDFFTAGSGTTTTTLQWSILLMVLHPDIQEKVHKEIKANIPDGVLPTMADRQKTVYTEAVLREIQRYGTVVPLALMHTAVCDAVVAGYVIPEGAAVYSNLYSVHFDRKYWGDPETFRPERFLDGNGALINHEQLIPFGTGPPGLPFIGNALFLSKNTHRPRHLVYDELSKQYGPVFRLNFFGKTIVVISNYEITKEAFKMDALSHRPVTLVATHRTGEESDTIYGIVQNSGKTWLDNRRFSLKTLRDFGSGKGPVEVAIQSEFEDLKDIAAHWKKFGEDGVPSNFIEAYLMEMEKHGSTESFNEKNLTVDCIDLFAAGSETTTTTLQWGLLLMALHPDIQEKVHKEIKDNIPDGVLPSMADRQKTVYTEAVLRELQRFGTIAPLALPHIAVRSTVLAGYVIPEGATVFSNLYSIHFDGSYWGDPDTFRPERFLDENGALINHEQLIPFGTGKRVCLGESLARMEIYLFFAAVMRQFRFAIPEGKPRPPLERQPGVTCSPAPFVVTVYDRTKA